MAVIHRYRCAKCDDTQNGWSDDVPKCCGKRMHWTPSKINTPEWGSPRQYIHLRDEPFGSRAELDQYARDQGLALGPSAEKHHGARNEEGLNLGKKYSYKGAPKS